MTFSIITDSAANLTTKLIKDNDIKVVSLSYNIGGKEYLGYVEGEETDYKAFYELLRSKEKVQTSLVNYEACKNIVCKELDKGNDVLYVSFSSSLSGSYLVAKNVAEDLKEQYTDRKIIVIDSLCASFGQGLLMYYVAKKRDEGLSVDDTAKWIEDNKLNLVHLFTVDDLFFLKRGGRLSGSTALMGSLLNIKPLLHMDNEGKLVMTGKVRGRRASLDAMIQRMGEVGTDLETQHVFIGHGDCIEDACYVEKQIKKLYKVKDVTINYIDSVIAAHSGPGTLAIFFMGTER